MALNKEQKTQVVNEAAELLAKSKLTVYANYKGLSVKAIQELRKSAKQNGTSVRVIKNRLMIQALKQVPKLKDTDTSNFKQQLLYAFNDQDEIAPAQSLNNFAKNEPNLVFCGAINADGTLISADDVKSLANLPSKDQLRGQLVGTIAAPLSGFVNVLNGNLRGVLNVLNARSEKI